MIRYFNIAGALIRISLMTAFQYRSDFLFEALTGALRTFGTLAPLWLVYGHTTEIGGWTVDEATLVMGFFLALNAFHGGLMEPNLGEVVEAIRQGTLDLWLIKPADAQLLVSVRRIDPAYVWDAFAALAVIAFALWRMPTPTPLNALLGVALFIVGLLAMYGVWLLAICTSFYWVRVDNLRFLLMSAADAGRWPLSLFSGWLRVALVAVLPVAVVTTFPAEAFRGTWTPTHVGVAFAVATVFLVGSRLAWKRSLSFYTSASS